MDICSIQLDEGEYIMTFALKWNCITTSFFLGVKFHNLGQKHFEKQFFGGDFYEISIIFWNRDK
jgi:hypothetical protein